MSAAGRPRARHSYWRQKGGIVRAQELRRGARSLEVWSTFQGYDIRGVSETTDCLTFGLWTHQLGFQSRARQLTSNYIRISSELLQGQHVQHCSLQLNRLNSGFQSIHMTPSVQEVSERPQTCCGRQEAVVEDTVYHFQEFAFLYHLVCHPRTYVPCIMGVAA